MIALASAQFVSTHSAFDSDAAKRRELLEQIRSNERTISAQSKRIRQFESYLACVVALVGRIDCLEARSGRGY